MAEPIRILVLDRGFVMACRCPEPEGYPFWLPVTNARIIRVWGTTEGLTQLCDGPLPDKTKLDAESARETINSRAVLRVIEVDQAKWERHLGGGHDPEGDRTTNGAGRGAGTHRRTTRTPR